LNLSSREVHIWHIALLQDDATVAECRKILFEDETQRADRFYFERDRRRFTVAHAALRQVLSRYLEVTPGGIKFSIGPKGKPDLVDVETQQIRFNLSHSGEIALLAVARGQCLGIDVEFIKTDFGGEEIAERFFSRNEVKTLQALPADQKPAAFFSCWTRKEAYIKAVGEGLSLPLDSFDVAFAPGAAPALLRVDADAGELTRWSMYDIPVPPEYKAALVIEGREHLLQEWTWKP
jgi:4'-phosphopantetheinyl transferase